MTTRRTCGALAAMLIASSALATAAYADAMTMWVRASGANAAAHLVDLWNSSHPDKVELTIIPDNQMVTKLATGVQAGDVPDMVSFDLIYMPDFMKAGLPRRPHRRPQGRSELRHRRAGLQGHRDLEGQALRRRLHAGRVDARSGTRTCSRRPASIPDKPPTHDRRDPCGRQEDPRARRRHLRLSISPAPARAATSSRPRR